VPSWKDLKRFCESDGWDLYKNTDHFFYQKRTESGEYKRTKVSKGTGEIYGALWSNILKKQLQVTKEYFNSKI
jgi:hypothetical protein